MGGAMDSAFPALSALPVLRYSDARASLVHPVATPIPAFDGGLVFLDFLIAYVARPVLIWSWIGLNIATHQYNQIHEI